MYFDQKNTDAKRGGKFAKQWGDVVGERASYDAAQENFSRIPGLSAGQLAVNAAAILPRDTWLEFDATTKTIMTSDEGGPLMSDLMPLMKPVNIGKIAHVHRTRSDSGSAQSSISGQLSKGLDKGVYDYDGTLVLIHDSSFGREWREVEGQASEGFDGLAEDQADSVRSVNRQIIGNIVNGTPNTTYKGYQALGIKTSPKVASLDLSIDLTSSATTYAQIEAVFIAALQQQQSVNFVKTPLTLYVSSAIWFNLMRRGSNDTGYASFLSVLQNLPGIAAIKQINDTSLLSGNEFFMIPLTTEHIQPLVARAVSTTPIPRLHPFADFDFVTWGATGIMIKADYNGKKGVLWAREIA